MGITNQESGTNIEEIAEGIYRINTPLPPEVVPGGFSFNQFLVIDDEPLLYHAGPRKLFPLVRQAVETVLPARELRYIAISHTESDECGSINEWLAAAPDAVPVCGRVAATVSIEDMADRAPRALRDGEVLDLGKHALKWFDTPHLPHAWDCGYLMENHTETLLCGDLFTQGGADTPAVTEADILDPSEHFRQQMDYYSHSKHAPGMIERLALENPTTLACMHGSVWKGNGAELLRALAQRLAES